MGLKHLKLHLRWIKFGFVSSIILLTSCKSDYLRHKLSSYATNGIFIVEDEDVCYNETKEYFFVKHCDSAYYSNAVLSNDVRNKDKTVAFKSFSLMYLENPDHFLDVINNINEPDLEYSTFWFNDYPDSVFIYIDNIMKTYYKKNGIWLKKHFP